LGILMQVFFQTADLLQENYKKGLTTEKWFGIIVKRLTGRAPRRSGG
jgi:hypothetical protein